MIQFWTTWNFIWYSGFKLKLYNLNTPLKTSIIATSLIGGYLVYVYPRRIKIKLKKDVYYRPPYYLLIIGDVIFHQLPMIDITCNNYSLNRRCIMYTYIPMFVWYNIANKIVNGKMDKLYGISVNKVLLMCSFYASGAGIFYHLIKKNN